MQIADKKQAVSALKVQVALTLILSVGLMFFGVVVAYSALVGGAIATVANAYFAKRVFADYRAQKPGKLVAQIYSAEITKLILVGALFAAAVTWIEPLSAGALFSLFLIVHLIPLLLALTGRG